MKNRIVIASLSTLALAGTAFADDAPAGGTGDGSGAPPATPTTPTAPAADAPADRYPQEIINRPLTFPSGVVALGADLATNVNNIFDPAFLRVLGGYGITDDFELNFAAYSFATSDAGKGSIDAGVGYKLLRGAAGGKLEVIARAFVGYGLAATIDATTGETSGALNPIQLGAHVQYNATPKIAIISGYSNGQIQLGIADANKAKFIRLPVSVGYQAAKNIYIQADTQLAQIKLADSENAFIGSDTTPLALYVTVTPVKNIDIYGGISLDLTPPDPIGVGDTFNLLAGARYYIGKL